MSSHGLSLFLSELSVCNGGGSGGGLYAVFEFRRDELSRGLYSLRWSRHGALTWGGWDRWVLRLR